MLRVAISEASEDEPSYKIVMSTGTDTITDILNAKKINIKTHNVFINGKHIKEELLTTPLSSFSGKENMLFITIKQKTIDKQRQPKRLSIQ